MKIRFLYIVLILSIVFVPQTQGEVILRLEFEGQTSVNTGETTNIDVYFRETATAGEPLRLNDANWGLTTANFQVFTFASSGNNAITAAVKNPVFDGLTDPTISAATANFPLTAVLNTPTGSPAVAGSSRLLLGTFSVTGGSVGSQSTFRLGPISGSNFSANDFILGDNAPNIAAVGTLLGASPSFTITAVPEPSSLCLIGVLAIGGFAAKRRRKAIEADNATRCD